jgi:hypothetical protein
MRRAHILGRLAVVGFFSIAGVARAAAPPDGETKSLPCRPTIACTADLVKPGLFELETGMLFRRLGDARQWTFPFLAKLTLATFAQLQIGSSGYTSQVDAAPARYFDVVTGGLKLHLHDQTSVVPSVSLSGAVGLPVQVAEQGYSPSESLYATAYVTKDFGFLHADLNLGLNDLGVDGGSRSQEWVALALSVPLPAPFGAMVESYYFTDAAPISSRDGGCLFALSLTPRPWLVFDFGGDVGYFPGTRAFSSFVGMTIVPVRLWP